MGPAIPRPKERPVPPVVLPIEEQGKPIESRPIPFADVLPAPVVKPQPQPVEPVVVDPVPVVEPLSVSFFGTELLLPLSGDERFHMSRCDDDAISDTWLVLADGRFDGLLAECLRIREERHLCDWAYLLMLQQIADTFLGKGTNEAVMLTAFLYCQSGYKMRIGQQDGALCLRCAGQGACPCRQGGALSGQRRAEQAGRLPVVAAAVMQHLPQQVGAVPPPPPLRRDPQPADDGLLPGPADDAAADAELFFVKIEPGFCLNKDHKNLPKCTFSSQKAAAPAVGAAISHFLHGGMNLFSQFQVTL